MSKADKRPAETGSTAIADERTSPAEIVGDQKALPPQGELKNYLGGLSPECPLDFLTIPTLPGEGAFSFQKWTQRLDDDGKGILRLTGRSAGGLIKMFDDEYAAVVAYVKEHSIFWESRGESNRVAVVRSDGKGHIKSRRDSFEGKLEPLAKFVFLSPMADQRSPEYRPQTLG